MSNSNKSVREEMERIYGEGCMFKRGQIEEKTKRKLKKTYKKFKEEKHYTRKKEKALEELMTYHHLKHKANGGKATVDNGAIVSFLAHQYIHSLSRQEEEIINIELRKYKAEIDRRKHTISYIELNTGKIIQYEQISFDDLGAEYETIRLEDNVKEDKEFLDVTEGMSEEEIREYEEHKRKRNERVFMKFFEKEEKEV